MSDKTESKVDTEIEAEELKDSELDQAVGGFSDVRWEFRDDTRETTERKQMLQWYKAMQQSG